MSTLDIPDEAYDAAETGGNPHHCHPGGSYGCDWPIGLHAAVDAAAPLIVAAELERLVDDCYWAQDAVDVVERMQDRAAELRGETR